ncbi:MAG: GOLPH3/VPS74 family protein [Streptosporangiales bacterium]
MALLLAEELALLAYNDETGKPAVNVYLPYGLGGALLAELALASKVTLDAKRVQLTDGSSTGDDLLDDAVGRIAAHPGRRPRWYVERLRKGVREAVVRRLVATGVLREESGRTLLVFPTTVYPAADPRPEQEVRQRLNTAVAAGARPDERTVALAVLVHACQLDKLVFTTVSGRELRDRLNQLTESDWAGKATRQAIQAVQAATLAAVAAGGAAGSGS